MNSLTFLFLVAILYDILSVWGVVEAVLLRLQWYWLATLMLLLIFLPPVGFGLTMFIKFWLRKKKPGPKKGKKKKDPDSYRERERDDLPSIPISTGMGS